MSVLEQLKYEQLKDLDQGGRLWELYRQAATEPGGGLYFFAKAVWSLRGEGRNLITRRCHLPICLVCEDDSITRLLVEWPRGHIKSTIATVCRPVQKLCRKVVAGQDPDDRFAIYSSSKLNACRQWRDIRNGVEGNEFFRFLFPELLPDTEHGALWNTEEGSVPRQNNPKEPTFDTLGGGKSTSRHYDDVTLDDLIDEQNFDSPTAVQMAIEYYRLSRSLLESPESGRIVVVGNRWGMHDLNYVIHTEEPFTSIITADSTSGPTLEGKFKCRNLPQPVMELLQSMPQGEPLFPERFNQDTLGRLLSDLKPRIFSSQYKNNPCDPDAVDFKFDWLQYCDLVTDEQGAACIRLDNDSELMPLADCNLYITWDPALGGKAAESENAIIVSAMDWKGRIFVVDESAKRCSPMESIEDVLGFARLYAKWLKNTGMEEVLFQKVLGKLLVERALAEKVTIGYRLLKTPTGMRKDQRIRAWVGTKFEEGRVWVRRKCTKFVDQYTTFGVEGAKRDLIDAFAYGTQLWSKPPSPEDKEREEEFGEVMESERGLTGYGSALRRTGVQ